MEYPNRLIPPTQLAEQLGVSVATIYRKRSTEPRSALPPAIKVGNMVRWRQEDIDAWVAAHSEAVNA